MPKLDLGFRSNVDSLVVYDRGTLQRLGSVEFTLLNDECYLDNIETAPAVRRQGVATQLVQALLEQLDLPYEKIRWGIREASGITLKHSLDRKFGKRSSL